MTIAIDGIDGTGKGTHCRLLRELLKKEGRESRIISFPAYDSFFGQMIADYLNGKYGSLYSIDPKLTALLFALDRKIFFENNVFPNNTILIFDRYVLSNMAHQGVKIAPPGRPAFFDWLRILEYEINRIPSPDISFVLDMDTANSVSNVAKKQQRGYTGLTYDLHESDAGYLENTRLLFLELAQQENAIVIRCDRDGILRNTTDIVTEIAARIAPSLKS
jgi:dTMP kinase